MHRLAAATLLLAACGGRAVPPDTPAQPPEPAPAIVEAHGGASSIQGLFEKLTIAINTRDGDLLLEILPPADLIDQAVACQGPNPVLATLDKVASQIDTLMAKLASAGVSIEFDSVTEDEDPFMQIEPGDSVGEGCTAGLPITMRRVKLCFFVTGQGQVKEMTSTFMVVRFGEGGWYVVGPG